MRVKDKTETTYSESIRDPKGSEGGDEKQPKKGVRKSLQGKKKDLAHGVAYGENVLSKLFGAIATTGPAKNKRLLGDS